MKYIKTFEELSPETYKRAGDKLINIGHIERGKNLLKFAKLDYNILLENIERSTSKKSFDGLESRVIESNFSGYKIFSPSYHSEVHEDNIDSVVDDWLNGREELGFIIELYFKSPNINGLPGEYNPITYYLKICNELEGEDSIDGGPLQSDLNNSQRYKKYENISMYSIDICEFTQEIKYDGLSYRGIPADRKSAIKLNNELREILLYGKFYDIIDDMFERCLLLGGDDLAEFIKYIKSIKINNLYNPSKVMNYIDIVKSEKIYM